MDKFKVKLILMDENDNVKAGVVADSEHIRSLREYNLSPLDEMLNALIRHEQEVEKEKAHKRVELLSRIAKAQWSNGMLKEKPNHYREVLNIIMDNDKEEAIDMLCSSGLWFYSKEELNDIWDETERAPLQF